MNSLSQSVKTINRTTSFVISIAIMAAYMTLAIGIFAPVLNIRKKILWVALSNDTYSLVEGIFRLFKNGHVMLSIIIFLFTILIPTGKVFTLNCIWNMEMADHHRNHALNWLGIIGKWSMLDVFILASTIILVKMSAIADAEAKWGIYMFVAHVVLSMSLAMSISKLNQGVSLKGQS